MEDNESKFCLLCLQNFSYSFRRHHCRVCGILCCDSCSSKRLTIKVDENIPPSNSTSPRATASNPKKKEKDGDSKPERVCDSCFNRLCFDSFSRHQEVMRAKKDQERRTEEERRERELTVTSAGEGRNSPMSISTSLFGWSSARSESSPQTPSKPSTKADQTKLVLNEAAAALEERGQRLKQTLDNSEQMKEVSHLFSLQPPGWFELMSMPFILGCVSISFDGEAPTGATKKE
jgi:hypothetical protein